MPDMAKRKHHPGHNLGQWLHPAKGKKPMAMPPAAGAAPAPTDDEDDDDDMSGMGDPSASGADTGSDDSGEVLLTVLKTGPGQYTLIQGDEDDGDDSSDASGGAGDASMGAAGDDASSSGDQGQTFDSKGPLLKAILDILNEDESSEGSEGGSEDQFQAGFGGSSDGSGS